jgi:hypothetical protein
MEGAEVMYSPHNDRDQKKSEPVAKVLSRLQSVERLCQGHYQAPCPLHEDSSYMLTVSEAEDGRALIECDDGCWLSQIVPALGLTVEDLFQCIDDIYIGSAAPAYPRPPASKHVSDSAAR